MIIKVKIKEDILTTKDVIFLINNKKFDCSNYKQCSDLEIQKQIKYEVDNKKEIKTGKLIPFDVNWICDENCSFYESDNEHHFTKDEYEKIDKEINESSDIFRIFSSIMLSKQEHEKYGGGFNVEQYSNTSVSDGRVRKVKSRTAIRDKE